MTHRTVRLHDPVSHARAGWLLPLLISCIGSLPGSAQDASAPLWQSPTAGKPLAIEWAPAGGQCFIFVRAADLRGSAPAARAWQSLGPRFEKALDAWQASTGIDWDNVDRLLLTLLPRSSGKMEVVSTVWLIDAAQAATAKGKLTDDGVLVCGPKPLVDEVLAAHGEPPIVRRQLNTLRKSTDQLRQVTVLLTPSFLLRETGDLFAGDLRPLKAWLEQLLSEDTQALSLSLHVADDFYAELRLQMTLERRRELRTVWPDLLRTALAQSNERLASLSVVDPYWQRLADRWEAMLDVTLEHLRFGWEDEQAVINLSLPAAAAHNLLLGGQLLLAEDGQVDSTPPSTALSLKQALNIRIEYAFSQQSFDDAFQGLIRQVNATTPAAELSLQVDGTSLAAAGVNRNQELANFRPGRRTVAQLLTLLSMRGNPTRARHPSEPAQSVIWTVAPHPERPEKQVLLITSRQAAEKNGYPLPTVFRKK